MPGKPLRSAESLVAFCLLCWGEVGCGTPSPPPRLPHGRTELCFTPGKLRHVVPSCITPGLGIIRPSLGSDPSAPMGCP